MTAASGEEIDWDHIATVLGNSKDGPQCASRWQKVLHPQTIKGAWTPEVRYDDVGVEGGLLPCRPHVVLIWWSHVLLCKVGLPAGRAPNVYVCD